MFEARIKYVSLSIQKVFQSLKSILMQRKYLIINSRTSRKLDVQLSKQLLNVELNNI